MWKRRKLLQVRGWVKLAASLAKGNQEVNDLLSDLIPSRINVRQYNHTSCISAQLSCY